MKFSWRQLASGLIEAHVHGSELELCSLEKDEFLRRATTELPLASYTVSMLTINLAFGQFMLRLTGLPGLHGMELVYKALSATSPTSPVPTVLCFSSTPALPESSMTRITGLETVLLYSAKHRSS